MNVHGSNLCISHTHPQKAASAVKIKGKKKDHYIITVLPESNVLSVL